MTYITIIGLVLGLTFLIHIVSGYRILGLFPYHAESHTLMFKSIMEGLALKGHTVHVLSYYPRETPLANYTDLAVEFSSSLLRSSRAFEEYEIYEQNLMEIYNSYIILHEVEAVMEWEATQKLLRSNEKYDLILAEAFLTDMIFGFAHKFKAPLVLLSATSVMPWASAVLANPQNPAFVPLSILSSNRSPQMNFFERCQNTFEFIIHLTVWYLAYVPTSDALMRKYFGDDMPPLLDIYRNASLLLTNTHPAINGGRPLAPTVIDVGGVHIKPAKNLPPDIGRFIEESPHGVIFFSMGSVLRAAMLAEKKLNAFLDTFSKIQERVLWKFEEEDLLVPDNVMIKEWMPQRDILAHPKVKLFITHGGLFSVLEAVSEGKPILGIPIFMDQGTNIKTLELQGVAKFIDYYNIDNVSIYKSVQEMLRPEYAKNAKELQRLFHDRPMSPIDTAIYWIEYVVRNNGTKILRSPAIDLPFYQYLLIDVILFLFVCLVACVLAIYYFFEIVLCRCKLKNVKSKQKDQ